MHTGTARFEFAVVDAAAAVALVVRVQEFAIAASLGNPDAKIMPDDRGHVRDAYHEVAGDVAAQPAEYAVVTVAPVYPLEPGVGEIDLVERRRAPVECVQVPHQRLHAPMRCIVEQVPVERTIMVPFVVGREFGPHEQQLLAGMRIHTCKIGSQVGEALPLVPRHTAEQRVLAVHDFVV